MRRQEEKKLETIAGKIEALQNTTTDHALKQRLDLAKTEILRALRGI